MSQRPTQFIENQLHFAGQNLCKHPVIRDYQGPCYFYDLQHIGQRAREFRGALPGTQIFFAMKANSNSEVLKTLRQEGVGLDVVSGGEIDLGLQAGFAPEQMIFSGVGKTKKEIEKALRLGLYQLNIESIPELVRVATMARDLGLKARIALRINPNVDVKTHPHIATGLVENKFGMPLSQIPELETLLEFFKEHIDLCGLSMHLGSQMQEVEGLRQALKVLRELYLKLQSRYPQLKHFNFGGGLGVSYNDGELTSEYMLLEGYAKAIHDELGNMPATLQAEPGRWLVAHGGIYVAQVQYLKRSPQKNFLILDGGMNHLVRPVLYEAYHLIQPLRIVPLRPKLIVDVVGPICESADYLAKNRELPEIQGGEFVAVLDAGAYGFSMANRYNQQELPREVCLRNSPL